MLWCIILLGSPPGGHRRRGHWQPRGCGSARGGVLLHVRLGSLGGPSTFEVAVRFAAHLRKVAGETSDSVRAGGSLLEGREGVRRHRLCYVLGVWLWGLMGIQAAGRGCSVDDHLIMYRLSCASHSGGVAGHCVGETLGGATHCASSMQQTAADRTDLAAGTGSSDAAIGTIQSRRRSWKSREPHGRTPPKTAAWQSLEPAFCSQGAAQIAVPHGCDMLNVDAPRRNLL